MNFFRKRPILISIVFVFCFNMANSQSTSVAGSFTINGKVTGMHNETMMLAYADPANKKLILDSAEIKNGIFHFKGAVESPLPANFCIKGSNHRYAEQNKNFYLENSTIRPVYKIYGGWLPDKDLIR